MVVPYREQSRVLIPGQETASQGFALPRFVGFPLPCFVWFVPLGYVRFCR